MDIDSLPTLDADDVHERPTLPSPDPGAVAFDVEVDLGEEELVGPVERRCVDLGASDDEDALLALELRKRLLDRCGTLGAPAAPPGVA